MVAPGPAPSSTTVQGVELYSITHLAYASIAGDNTLQRRGYKEDQQGLKKSLGNVKYLAAYRPPITTLIVGTKLSTLIPVCRSV